ncbi:MAG: serine/threonine protein kinase, partial [Conexibacter sp.]|nr:serine/threonine protein kinase [Conexibacter sp.]
LVRGRSAALDLVAATVWAAGLAAAAGAIGHTLGGRVPAPDPRGAALGAAAAVLLAVSAQAVRGTRGPRPLGRGLRIDDGRGPGRARPNPRALP